jgi:hypothetical protein
VRRTITVLLAAAIGAIAALAVYDAVSGSSPPGEPTAQDGDTDTPEVVSTPHSVEKWPRVLRRTIRLERVVGAGWEELGELEQGTYTLRARIGLPHKANVDVWIEAMTSADVIDILGRSVPRNCERRQGRDVCLVRVDFVEGPDEPLRLLARKMSRGRMLLRLRIEFDKTSAG